MDEKKAEIKLAKNGPLLVKGPVELVNSDGTKLETKENFALCRCGQSKNKPFCDGSHKTNGFEG